MEEPIKKDRRPYYKEYYKKTHTALNKDKTDNKTFDRSEYNKLVNNKKKYKRCIMRIKKDLLFITKDQHDDEELINEMCKYINSLDK